MMVRALREFWAAFCVACGLRRGLQLRARAWSNHERIFVVASEKNEDSPSSQQQHPVIDLAELVLTKAGTIEAAYSLTSPHVHLPLV
jgi:hypothetical protein